MNIEEILNQIIVNYNIKCFGEESLNLIRKVKEQIPDSLVCITKHFQTNDFTIDVIYKSQLTSIKVDSL